MSGIAVAPVHVRVACISAVVFVFALSCLFGRLTTYFVFLSALLVLLTPSIRAAFAMRSRNSIDVMFVAAALLPAAAFSLTAEDPQDLLFAINFAPLLLAIPFRWQLERFARADGATLIGWLSLAGATVALVVAFVQVVVLGYDRAGQPIMSAFQFANTALLLGFLAPAGLFSAGRYRRLLLAGPVIGILTVVLSGTRGAILAVPPLALLLFGFALVRSRNRRGLIAIAMAGLAVALIAALLADQLGFGRAIDGFLDAVRALAGDEVDGPVSERLVMYAAGWQAFLRSPILGYGWEDMISASIPYVSANMVEIMNGFRHLHNGLLSFAVAAGIPGIVSFLILSVAPVVAVLDTPRDKQFLARLYLATVLCVGYAGGQLTILMLGFEFHTVQYAFMTMAILALARTPTGGLSGHSAVGKSAVGPETAKTA